MRWMACWEAGVRAGKPELDLLVIHGVFNPMNLLAARAARAAGLPYVACPHALFNSELLRKRRTRKALYWRLLEKPYLKRAAAIQVQDSCQAELIARLGIDSRCIVAPHGFDPAGVPGADFSRADAREGSEFLYLGRLDRHTKGLDLLLKAFALGRSEGRLPPTLRLTFAGPDGGDRSSLIALARDLGIGDHVRFPGPVDREDRWEAIRRCDVLVLPSRHDAFPNVILEAMVMSRPVIVSSNTGISSTVKRSRCGIVVHPDRDSILCGMSLAMELKADWDRMGRLGREYAHAHLTWDMLALQAATEYEDVILESAVIRRPIRLSDARNGRCPAAD
jgi:glycosyltransferase involved in cell wall biosynthesis